MTEVPLSARVEAPAQVQPAPVAGVSWRNATLDVVDAVVELYAAMSRVDHPEWAETRDEIEQEFQHSWVELRRDSLVAEADGAIVAHGLVIAPPAPETIVRSVLFGGVHPQHRGRGIGRALLGWQEGRARQQLAASTLALPGWILCYSYDRDPSAARLLEREGFATERYFSQLQRELSAPIPELELPAPLRLATLSPELSEATRVAKNAAFRDHWGSQPTSVEGWNGQLSLPSLRPELSFLAMEGGEVVGFVIVNVNEADFELQGFAGSYISLVGVVAPWRRRGVAPALLAASLRAARDAGLERAVLDVDSESPTGALGLYTGMGFEAAATSRAHVKSF
ncbi:GNAT family N-acetyltransferase [Lysinimonas soli]|uniref:GNAT family N-acetyltransferase n=1 Tax=Lysinimonas soli TaxID=1074233 RepID=A0ABW0NVC2_9MICO